MGAEAEHVLVVQHLGEHLGAAVLVDEDNHLVVGQLADDGLEGGQLLLFGQVHVVLHDAVERQLLLVDKDLDVLRTFGSDSEGAYVLHEAPADLLDLVVHGGGEHHHLLLVGGLQEQLLDVGSRVWLGSLRGQK